MTLLLKDPAAALDYAVDWGAEYLSGDVLFQSAWEVAPSESGGVTVIDSDFDQSVATVTASGGVPGRMYTLMNHVVFASGLTDSRSIVLRVEKR